MALVATLIADPTVAALTSEVAERATAAVPANELRWLSPGVACDILLGKNAARQGTEQSLRDALGPAPVDVVVQEAAARRKAFLIADMDSTMIDQECVDELAAEIGLKDKVAAITTRAMNGEIAFEPALRERVALLEGLPLSVIGKVLETRITMAAGGPELVRTMKANGAYTALVSGGFTVFTGPIAEMIGFDDHRANVLIEKDGFLTGKVVEPILGRQAKTDALHDITQRLGISPLETLAVGDGANDLGMLQLAGTGVALHAKPAVAAAAGVRIDHSDLTALLYIQGYSREEFAT